MMYGQRERIDKARKAFEMRKSMQPGLLAQRLENQRRLQQENQRRLLRQGRPATEGDMARQRQNQRRIQRGKEIDERKRFRDLYNRENKKIYGYQRSGGKRQNLSRAYLRNLDILQHMGQGTRRPLDMQEVFGQPSPLRPSRG